MLKGVAVTEYLAFDEPWLIEQLRLLSRRPRVAFAAACAQRLYPPYAPFADEGVYGGPGELSAMLDGLWSKCEADQVDLAWAEQSHERLAELIPHDDDVEWGVPGHEEANLFSHVLFGAIHSYRQGDAESAAEAAWYAYQVRWMTVRDRHDMDYPLGVEAAEHEPIVQAELTRQRRDLEELLRGPDAPELVRRLRERATREGLPSD